MNYNSIFNCNIRHTYMNYKNKYMVALCTIGFLASSFTIVLVTQWHIPKGAKANFTIDGLFGKDVHGSLDIDSSFVLFEPKHLKESKMSVTLPVASIHTGSKKRDKHLRNEDFFDVEKYPLIRFQSSDFAKVDDSTFAVTGTLTIKEVSKTVTIPFEFAEHLNTGLFTGAFTIRRLDYGVGTKYKWGIGKEVRIQLSVPVEKIILP